MAEGQGRNRRVCVLLAAALLALASCGETRAPFTYSGTVEFPDVEVGSLVGGRVLRVEKQEGDSVSGGEVLVTLDPATWQSALDEAKSLAEVTSRELALLEAGPRAEEIAEAKATSRRLELLWKVVEQGARPEEIAAAREEVKVAAAALVEAEKDLKRVKDLASRHVEPQASLDRVEAARDSAIARKAAAEQRVLLLERGQRPEEVEAARQAWLAQQERVKALEAGARPEEIAAKRATLDAAKARIRAAEATLAELVVTAPADAFVQTLDIRPGDLLRADEPVSVLLLREEPWIIVYVPEADLARVNLGQHARIVPDGHPPLAGHVTWISRRAEYTPRNVQTRDERTSQVFAVKVVIEGDTSRLKDGMWADVALQ